MEKNDIEIGRHSLAHVLASALKHIYGDELKLTIGPAIDNGCYYDVDYDKSISDEEFKAIKKEMTAIINKAEIFERKIVSREEALEIFKDNIYKQEIINDLPADSVITVYTNGDFVDLCRGPHLEKSSKLANWGFEIAKVNGAYWRGGEKNKMLKRIYVYAFPTKKELFDYKLQLAEAIKRDHRKIGKELGLFMFSPLVGKGLPMWLPKGFVLRRTLSDYIIDKELSLGYQHVMTPSIGSVDLYKTSGHWEHYKDDMFPAMKLDDESYVLRPMNCPHHVMIFKNDLHSYKDLPYKIAEVANDFRYEDSGSLCGIERARSFTQNDSHIFCTKGQIKSEVEDVIKLIIDVYHDFGLNKYKFRLSLRDKANTEKYFGNDELWNDSEKALRDILVETGADFYTEEGEAAFYGPKIDVQVETALGHSVTLSTVQLDYQLPERFDLEYTDENNEKVRPVMIHRAILGSLDRFVALLIEETKGVFPVWLAPVQVKVMNISENTAEYAYQVASDLKKLGYKVELDDRNEKISYKIREASVNKIPYMIILGDKEKENNTITVRMRGNEELSNIPLDEFVERMRIAILNKGANL